MRYVSNSKIAKEITGWNIAKTDISNAAINSIVENTELPNPDSKTEVKARAFTVINCTLNEITPPNSIEKIHLIAGFTSIKRELNIIIPAIIDNGVDIKSSILSIHGI